MTPRARRHGLFLGALVAAVAQVAVAQAETPAEARGQALAIRNCSMCHATGLAGQSPNPAAPTFRRLFERYPADNLARALTEGILMGHPKMREPRFSPRQVLDLIAYLKSIQLAAHAETARPQRRS